MQRFTVREGARRVEEAVGYHGAGRLHAYSTLLQASDPHPHTNTQGSLTPQPFQLMSAT